MLKNIPYITDPDCLFCKIIEGSISSYKVYEDADTYAFLDINPNNHGHTLVVPKDHFENIYGTPDETLCRTMITARKVAIAVKNALNADGVNININNETAAGQIIFHTHIHIIPRFNNDGFKHWAQKSYLPGEAESVLEKIKEKLK
ncbi:MAG: HIT domain-containing protein [Candidatus Pacebacteria bacterium]|nr:HIT domain-containing protein [Candidatus Paceibacterota bacterium]